ncbi:DNA glycosylase superfamily protein [Rhynchospora pubera]|uniref:DNA glycosylase superfamily protein n=1 Tax=Rhynchospora pubera TaxID=906938 RepID=A0AAV8DG12_9POAL|nr:DNA glycosylase superfamily protein [Rhynchospora pubera]KAJ4817921.1 DNA glycosylase superfamily protein [Rhynchospora pubera]
MSESKPRRSTSSIGGGGGGGNSSGSGTRKTSSPRPVKAGTEKEKEKSKGSPSSSAGSTLRRRDFLLRSNFSMDASCSSDASTDSFCSRASTGRIGRRLSGSSSVSSYTSGLTGRRSNSFSEPTKGKLGSGMGPTPEEMAGWKRRCSWVTPNTDACYIAFHDEEWGVPVHDDKRLFELLVLSGALAELTWPSILSKRHVFREVFMDFDPVSVSKINEKKLIAPGSLATSLLSETKLRAIVENAREMLNIINEFGSFDRYVWGFVNNSPIVGRFRYQRQVPVRTSKADSISKDLVRRGFRGVGPTVIYSFMQVCGLTNDHLISCYRFDECNNIFQNGTCSSADASLTVLGASVMASQDTVSTTDIEALAANADELSIS